MKNRLVAIEERMKLVRHLLEDNAKIALGPQMVVTKQEMKELATPLFEVGDGKPNN